MKKLMRFISTILAMIILALSVNIIAFADNSKNDESGIASEAFSYSQFESDEVVKFIVTLNSDCVVESMQGDEETAEFLSSSEGKDAVEDVELSQEQVIKRIKKEISDAVVLEKLSFAINAIIVETKHSNLKLLESIKGVESVTVSQEVTLSTNDTAALLQNDVVYTGNMMQSTIAAENGYTGKGMVVAVIDSALDVNHEAFATTPPEASLSQADIDAAVKSGLLNANATTNELYISEKIPFAYDYSNGDADVTAPPSNNHGTHVSGLAVGNSDSFKGIAPDAQLVFMKVFDDDMKGGYDWDICAAIDDCAILGVDVVNLSLGFPSGFSFGIVFEEFLVNCTKVGTYVVASAGNENEQASNIGVNGTGYPLATEPDSGLVGSPGSSLQAMSVASIEDTAEMKTPYFLIDDKKIYFTDSNTGLEKEFISYFDNQTLEYIEVPGVGNVEDYAGIDVSGKIALIRRGTITFFVKEEIAASFGAVGVIIANTDDTAILVGSINAVPIIAMKNSDAQMLLARENKTLTVSKNHFDILLPENAGQMAQSSSVGVLPDMTLKPEITAPGGNAYSALPDGKYGLLSGTSMASPQIAGVIAVIKQRYKDELANMPIEKQNDFISTLLMSTAQIVYDPNGVPYTPRKQGSGLAQIDNVISAEAYVTVKDNNRPVAQLGSSVNGVYSTEITINNVSSSSKQYDLSAISIVPKIEKMQAPSGKEYNYMMPQSRYLESNEFIVTFSEETVTVEPGQSATISINFELTEEGKKNLKAFENGIYMEGFIVIEDNSQDGIELHVPYIGFYGDWHALSIFDKKIYSGEDTSLYGAYVSVIDPNGNEEYLGVNKYAQEFLADENKIAINGNKLTGQYLPMVTITMLRNARSMELEVLDENGNALQLFDPYTLELIGEKRIVEYERKTLVNSGMVFCYQFQWAPIKFDGTEFDYIDEGTYKIRVTAMPDGIDDPSYAQVLEFPFIIESIAPSINGYEVFEQDGERYITVKATDNHYLQLSAWVSDGDICADPIVIDEQESTAETEIILNVTDLIDQGKTNVQLYLMDYAGNEYLSDALDLTNYYTKPSSISFVENVFECADETTIELEAFIEPSDAVVELEWSCDNPEVATIISTDKTRVDSETGRTYYTAEVAVQNVDGVANITVTTKNGKTAVATINAKAVTHFEALEEAINNLQDLVETSYTVESWNAFFEELTLAKQVLENVLANQDEVDAAVQSLEIVVQNLVEAGTTTELEALVEKAKEDITLYTQDAKAEILAQIELAQELIDARATQDDLTLGFDTLKSLLETGEKLPIEEPKDEPQEDTKEEIKEDINSDNSQQSPQTGDINIYLYFLLLIVIGAASFWASKTKITNKD